MDISPQDIRVSDKDRQRVADLLAEAYGEGRLQLPEYQERLDSVFAATVARDLTVLTLDLPAAQSVPAAAPLRVRRRPGRMPGALAVLWTLWLIGVSVNTVVYGLVVLTSDGAVYPWPLWVAGPAGTALGVITLVTRPHWRRSRTRRLPVVDEGRCGKRASVRND
ncbi:protein of unknown function [Streptomyces sp. DvalAA-14]|uniref:DUF1707 SHOCT-like domain-containing protein n=1 Tax=unclassified Streptomyces TaxID=2593676 RepID=UPI00081B8C9D|nr:DUF1707 domain-containing protein [Streptomyces sp. DvalAA-14]MYS21718.1 DUF1707 domain-containing protein [Streptomyces sp. SID4948]SCD99546.1 protein of unknown function [Streptomyces sp. DvalAA-14]